MPISKPVRPLNSEVKTIIKPPGQNPNNSMTASGKKNDMNFSHILEDADRPILEFDDTKARLQNIAIIGANLTNIKNSENKPKIGSKDITNLNETKKEIEKTEREMKDNDTPRQIIEIEDETQKNIEIDIGDNLEEFNNERENEENIQIIYPTINNNENQEDNKNNTTEYMPKSHEQSIIAFSVTDSPQVKIPESEMLVSMNSKGSPKKDNVARKLFEDGGLSPDEK